MGSAGDFTYVLTVLTGPNAGAQERLDKRRFRIGSSSEADFILDDFEGPDVEISVARGKLRVVSERDEVQCQSGKTCLPGKPLFTDMPATLRLDDRVQINLSAACAAKTRRSSGLRIGAMVVMAAALVGGVVYAAQQAQVLKTSKDAMSYQALAFDSEQAAIESAAAIVTDKPEPKIVEPQVTTADAADALGQALAAAGLTGIEVTPDLGVIRVSGLYSPSQKSDWTQVRDIYEAEFGHIAPLLITIDQEDTVKPPLAVASVWLGEKPELTTRSGKVFSIGQVTETGWRVSEIMHKAVLLERGSQKIVIDF